MKSAETSAVSDRDRPKSSIPQKQDLVLKEQFSYQFFEKNRYEISEEGNYEALCNNGFIKLYSKLCRVYWHTQNEFTHEVMDWKFHISVTHKDLRKAWNLIAAIFIKMKCRAGMKTIYLKEAEHPQKGREITLYLIKYDSKFTQSQFAGDFGFDIDIQHSEDYWFQLCQTIQTVLSSYGVEPNGLADGDYPLGKYISLRNQAFIHNRVGESVYPPNEAGWNPLHYKVPIDLARFRSLREGQNQPKTLYSKAQPVIFVVLALLGLTLWFKASKKLKK